MWWFTVTVKLIAEIALLALLGRWALAWLLRAMGVQNCAQNPFYLCLDVVAKPALRLAALCSPRWVLRQHLPLVALALVSGVWVLALWGKINICLQVGVATCR
jgi:hypothetical protein